MAYMPRCVKNMQIHRKGELRRLKNRAFCINCQGSIRSVFAEWQCLCDPGLHTYTAHTLVPGQLLMSWNLGCKLRMQIETMIGAVGQRNWCFFGLQCLLWSVYCIFLSLKFNSICKITNPPSLQANHFPNTISGGFYPGRWRDTLQRPQKYSCLVSIMLEKSSEIPVMDDSIQISSSFA